MLYGMIANLVTKTRAPLFDNSANWGLKHEDVEFKTADMLTVKKERAWTEKGKSRIAGYADPTEHPAKVIEWFEKCVHSDRKIELAVANS